MKKGPISKLPWKKVFEYGSYNFIEKFTILWNKLECWNYKNFQGQTSAKQDKTWAEFSILELAICMLCNFGVISELPNLKLKTRPKQLLGFLLLVIALPAYSPYMVLQHK
jgi:hypothetical protein